MWVLKLFSNSLLDEANHYIGFANMSKRIFSSRAERLVSLAIENKSKSWGNYNPSEVEMKTNNGNKDSTGDNVSVQLLTSVRKILHAYAEVPTLAATDVTNNDDVSDILRL